MILKFVWRFLDKQFGLFLSAGNASERWWRLVRGGVACAILLNGYEKRLDFFEKVGQKGENMFWKKGNLRNTYWLC